MPFLETKGIYSLFDKGVVHSRLLSSFRFTCPNYRLKDMQTQ
jgi:hypothetical protein